MHLPIFVIEFQTTFIFHEPTADLLVVCSYDCRVRRDYRLLASCASGIFELNATFTAVAGHQRRW